jgi:hypothetical protein
MDIQPPSLNNYIFGGNMSPEQNTDISRVNQLVEQIHGLEGLTFTEARANALRDIVKLENELFELAEKYEAQLGDSPLTAKQLGEKIKAAIAVN